MRHYLSKEELTVKVISIVVDKLNVAEEEVVSTAHFANDLGADSLDQTELVMAIEEAFDIYIKDEDASSLQTVGSVVAYLERTLAIARM